MLRHYCGEFLVVPSPLHYGLNWCSHNCFYCFANLNKPDRRSNNASIKKFQKALENPADDSIEARMLRANMPITISNDSDPCAKSNAGVFLPIWEQIEKFNLPVAFQTKGGCRETEDMIINGRRNQFYITLTSDDDDLLRRAEPGAPPFEQRMELIRRAVAAGHFVIVGMNPLIPHWWIDFEGVISRLRSYGVTHLWIGKLHFATSQLANMPPKRKSEWATEVHLGSRRTEPPHFQLMKTELEKHFNVYRGTDSSRIHFWKEYGEGIKTVNCWLAHLTYYCKEHGVKQIITPFDAFADFIIPDCMLDYYGAKCKELIQPFRNKVWQHIQQEPVIYTMYDALKYHWDMRRYKTHLRVDDFSILIENDGTDVLDEDGNPYVVFTLGGSQDTHTMYNDGMILYDVDEAYAAEEKALKS